MVTERLSWYNRLIELPAGRADVPRGESTAAGECLPAGNTPCEKLSFDFAATLARERLSLARGLELLFLAFP
jgi:hypothetical protein